MGKPHGAGKGIPGMCGEGRGKGGRGWWQAVEGKCPNRKGMEWREAELSFGSACRYATIAAPDALEARQFCPSFSFSTPDAMLRVPAASMSMRKGSMLHIQHTAPSSANAKPPTQTRVIRPRKPTTKN